MNGSPKLQLNRAPTPGGSVGTTELASQVVVSVLVSSLIKSLGSIGNILPPIWNARVWAEVHGNEGTDEVEAGLYLGETVVRILLTTSVGPRMRELP